MLGGLDIGYTVLVQCHRRGENDEEGDDVGKSHADHGVDFDAAEIGCRLHGGIADRPGSGVAALLFDFLRRLPEKQIRADGSAENRDDRRDIVGMQRNRWQERLLQHGPPRNPRDKRHADIGEQGQGQPLQDAHVALVRDVYLQTQ